MEWDGMGWNGMDGNGMEWNGMEWNGMEWGGMEWNGMECNDPMGVNTSAMSELVGVLFVRGAPPRLGYYAGLPEAEEALSTAWAKLGVWEMPAWCKSKHRVGYFWPAEMQD